MITAECRLRELKAEQVSGRVTIRENGGKARRMEFDRVRVRDGQLILCIPYVDENGLEDLWNIAL